LETNFITEADGRVWRVATEIIKVLHVAEERRREKILADLQGT
jgi:hypothetical protein